MLRIIRSTDKPALIRLMRARATSLSDAERVAARILADVRRNGDRAVIRYAKKFDGLDLGKIGFEVKRDEIEVLQLIGASKWYIRKPFIAEGVFFGFFSGTVAFALFMVIFLYFQPFLTSYLAGIPKLPLYNLASLNMFVYPPSLEFILLSYVLTIFFGMSIGFVGNYLSTSKYIR